MTATGRRPGPWPSERFRGSPPVARPPGRSKGREPAGCTPMASGRPSPHDERTWAASASESFAPHPDEVAAVRGFVGQCAEWWGLDGTDVVLIASELASNAVLHGRTDFVVTMRSAGDLVRLEVDDRSTRPLAPRPESAIATSGRGLAVVVALADEWGVERRHDGKRVWMEIRLP